MRLLIACVKCGLVLVTYLCVTYGESHPEPAGDRSTTPVHGQSGQPYWIGDVCNNDTQCSDWIFMGTCRFEEDDGRGVCGCLAAYIPRSRTSCVLDGITATTINLIILGVGCFLIIFSIMLFLAVLSRKRIKQRRKLLTVPAEVKGGSKAKMNGYTNSSFFTGKDDSLLPTICVPPALQGNIIRNVSASQLSTSGSFHGAADETPSTQTWPLQSIHQEPMALNNNCYSPPGPSQLYDNMDDGYTYQETVNISRRCSGVSAQQLFAVNSGKEGSNQRDETILLRELERGLEHLELPNEPRVSDSRRSSCSRRSSL